MDMKILSVCIVGKDKAAFWSDKGARTSPAMCRVTSRCVEMASPHLHGKGYVNGSINHLEYVRKNKNE